MARKKIIIRKDIKNDFITDNDDIQDISLVIELKSQTRSLKKIDLSKHLVGLSKTDQIKRRKEFSKIVAFAKNTRRSTTTLSSMLKTIKNFITISDMNEILFFEDKDNIESSLVYYKKNMMDRFNKKEIALSSVNTFRSQLFSFLIDCFGYKEKELQQYYPKINQRTGKIKNATILDSKGDKKVLSKTEYSIVLSIFLGMTEHIDHLIKNDPKERSFAFKNNFKMKNHKVIDDKLLNQKSSLLLLLFIGLTGSNLTPALSAKRNDISIVEGERDIIHLTLRCNRKSKIQEHKFILKKYQKRFFDYIIEHSKKVDQRNDAFLFPYIKQGSLLKTSLNNDYMDKLYKKLNDQFPIKNDEGENLKISARILRSSYASFFNDIDLRSAALFNSVETAAKYYSEDNFTESNNNLQNAMNLYTLALADNGDISKYKKEIDVKFIEKEDLNIKNLNISNSGLICSRESDKELLKYNRKLKKKGVNIDSIDCANVFSCFSCENSIITNSFDSIYVLVSLKNYLEETLYNDEIGTLFSNKDISKKTINKIDEIITQKIEKKLITKVNKFIKENGYHPLWEMI